jgi:NAD(P)-dependent dehydrogenase (short-subunit alcohol dehydrogenase family)
MGVLAGKVVIIAGGGRGIGRECALLAAREGARVIVNDLGGSVAGRDTGSADPAAECVAAISAGGGEALADSRSITDEDSARALISMAIERFGRLDGVINPAGILRDGMFHKMSRGDWDEVIDVHLNGAFNLCRAAIELFRARNSGSFVLFTSTSGLVGNVGQANYAAAKMGVVGLSRIIAMEGAVRGVRSNVIAPFAWTRMIESIPVKDEASATRVERMRSGMRADQIAPLAIALCADSAAHVSGQIFGVRGNEVFLFDQPRPIRAMARLDGWTASSILDHALPAFAPDFTDLGASASVFNWDPP